jgi:dsDNA-binding SOS-regulon protein
MMDGGVQQLRDVFARLTSTLEEENYILQDRRDLSLDAIIHKKSQLLLELMRAQKSCSPEAVASRLAGELNDFKVLMRANQRLLSVHLAAAKDVSNTILDALRQNHSDGTYEGFTYLGRGAA